MVIFSSNASERPKKEPFVRLAVGPQSGRFNPHEDFATWGIITFYLLTMAQHT